MSKTTRKFRGKAYRQGHEPCELELTRKRAEKRERQMRAMDYRFVEIDKEVENALKHIAIEEQKDMGY